uniref:Reverse transcriptase domain-containing protein n=1 Tax=Lactuca sativa TaxID=4236 RepID=A0A9R1WI69_LACSA|nr:hypothetical protein LSAT_V11C100033170 [Lactuca sativa]
MQTPFIKNKYILDGPLILNEVIVWLKKNKKVAFAFKVDFEKVFDCLSWEYLDSILQQMEFGDKWQSWIHGCLSFARISVLINGSATSEFGMERGISQGDPLSPFLFIIAVEGLNIALEMAKQSGAFVGIQLPPQGPKVNMSKSKIVCFDVPNCELELMARYSNCSIGSLPFIYLGLSVGASMARVSYWNPIIEKFQARLSKWKATNLSFGGRLTLCKVVLSSLGTFYFSLFRNCPENTWAEVIKSIYGDDGGFDRPSIAKRKNGCWGTIANIPKILDKDSVSFANHFHLSVNANGVLKWSWTLDPSGCPISMEVWQLICKWWRMSDYPPASTRNLLQCKENIEGHQMLARIHEAIRLTFIWVIWKYRNLKAHSPTPISKSQSTLAYEIKVNCFIWRAIQKKIPSAVALRCKGVDIENDKCGACVNGVECSDHILVHCPFACVVRKAIFGWCGLQWKDFISVGDLIAFAKNWGRCQRKPNRFLSIFHGLIWILWKLRNDRLFNRVFQNPNYGAGAIKSLVFIWIKCKGKDGIGDWENWNASLFCF